MNEKDPKTVVPEAPKKEEPRKGTDLTTLVSELDDHPDLLQEVIDNPQKFLDEATEVESEKKGGEKPAKTGSKTKKDQEAPLEDLPELAGLKKKPAEQNLQDEIAKLRTDLETKSKDQLTLKQTLDAMKAEMDALKAKPPAPAPAAPAASVTIPEIPADIDLFNADNQKLVLGAIATMRQQMVTAKPADQQPLMDKIVGFESQLTNALTEMKQFKTGVEADRNRERV